MKTLEVGTVFKRNNTKYVLLSVRFQEWWNTGGMGTYHYEYVKLEDMISNGDYTEQRKIPMHVYKDTNESLRDEEIEVVEDEAPFEIKEEVVTLYSARRKKQKQLLYLNRKD